MGVEGLGRRVLAATVVLAAAVVPATAAAIGDLAVQIDSGPSGTAASSSARFTFSSTGGAGGTTFTCRLDDAAVQDCSSPKDYTGLANGDHVFTVTARDGRGNTATDAQRWTVAVAPLTVEITEGPRGEVASRDATFAFSTAGGEPPRSTRCSLDGAAATACASPKAYTGLAAGGHVFVVTVTDSAGRTAAARREWSVNAQEPQPQPDPPAGPPAAPQQEPPGPSPVVSTEAAALDADGDGLRGDADPCPDSRGGRRALVPGCSLTEVVNRPLLLLGRQEDAATHARHLLGSLRGLATRRLPKRVASATRTMRRALARADAGDFCGAARSAGRSVAALRRIDVSTGRAVRRFDARQRRRPPTRHGDVDEVDLQIAAARARGAAAADLRREGARTAAALRLLCRSGGPRRTFTGVVGSTEAGGQVLRLVGGRRVLLGALTSAAPLVQGARVRVRGRAVKGAGVVAETASPVAVPKPTGAKLPQVACLELRIAPVQLPDEDVVHRVEGYTHEGVLRLDQAARVAAGERAPCVRDAPDGRRYVYSLTVHLKYTRLDGQVAGKVLANDLQPGSWTAALPQDAKGVTATLTATGYRSTCKVSNDVAHSCTDHRKNSVTTYPVQLHQPGAYGMAKYAERTFMVDDRDEAGFGRTTFTWFKGFHSKQLAGTDARLEGLGYVPLSATASSRPKVHVVQPGHELAVHNEFGKEQRPSDFIGVRGGLVGARIVGTRNGHPFRYSADIDQVVTDAVCRCFPGPDGFHRLPWKAGTALKVTQGNHGDFTHKGGQAWAFDFDHPMKTPIPATRGGEVVDVVEHNTKASHPKECGGEDQDPCAEANFVTVRHMDGTYAQYLHLAKNGAAVSVGDTVHRGDRVGYSGNTGRSTGPHLHFHVMGKSWTGTIPVRFQAGLPFDHVVDCYLPRKGDNPFSNND